MKLASTGWDSEIDVWQDHPNTEELALLGLSYYHMLETLLKKKSGNVRITELADLVDTYKIELEHKLEHGVLNIPEFYDFLQRKYGVDDG